MVNDMILTMSGNQIAIYNKVHVQTTTVPTQQRLRSLALTPRPSQVLDNFKRKRQCNAKKVRTLCKEEVKRKKKGEEKGRKRGGINYT